MNIILGKITFNSQGTQKKKKKKINQNLQLVNIFNYKSKIENLRHIEKKSV
ncbi:hypothetical protein LguiA_019156 [Lonicera macranthoides]